MRTPLLTLLLTWCTGGYALTVNITVNRYPTCNYPSGNIQANATGGVGPYTYLWTTGATTAAVHDLPPGTYSVTVTDANNEQATDEIVLTGQPYALSDLADVGATGLCNTFTDVLLEGPGNGNTGTGQYMGPLPYMVNGQTMQEFIHYDWILPVDTFYVASWPAPQFGGWQSYTFSDGAGCTGTLNEYIGYPIEWPDLTILDVQGACSGGTNGAVTFQTGMEGHGQFTQVKIETIANHYLTSFGAGNAVSTNSFALAPGDYLLTQFMSESSFLATSACRVSIPLTIPDLGSACGNLSGTVFLDNNEDCVQQGNEPRTSGVMLEILPGPFYALTTDGQFGINLPLGSYTVEQQSAVLDDHCISAPEPFTLTLGAPFRTVNVADTAIVPMDASVSLASGAARPGFEMNVAARMVNNTLASTGASTLSITFDPALSFVSAAPTPNVSGNTLIWNIAAFSSFQERQVQVRFLVPPDIGLLGTDLVFNASFNTGNSDAVPANNTAALTTTVTGSYDPNDKTACTSSGSSNGRYDIEADEWIDYTIRFQNTGTDTAFNIVITDTIASELDLGTFQAGAASHAHKLSIREGNVLRWAFYNIQLPDSNVNEPRSHGFVSFRIRPRVPVAPSTVIENIANIHFDFNPPVITEPSVLVAEFSTAMDAVGSVVPGLRVSPNPTRGPVRIDGIGEQLGALRILDLSGRQLHHTFTPQTVVDLDLSDVPAGAYLIERTSGLGTVERTRLIIADRH
ncbi:MAG: DUF7619 domain-containing protein [Flavobacteriales bacterium]